jgi:cysteine dioxygenase
MRGRRQLLSLLERWDRREAPIPGSELLAALEDLRLGHEDLIEAIGFDEACYRRTIIHSRPHYQVLVLCWRSGQRSPIHDHRGSNCVVRVIQGRASETRFDPTPCGRLVPTWSHEHLEGATTACCGEEIHQMGNFDAPGRDLVTLHVYTPPPRSWRFYQVNETTLAGHDRLIKKPARTVRVELAHLAPPGPMGRKTREGTRVAPEP